MGIVIFCCAFTIATATHIIATVIPECIFWYDKHLDQEMNKFKKEKTKCYTVLNFDMYCVKKILKSG